MEACSLQYRCPAYYVPVAFIAQIAICVGGLFRASLGDCKPWQGCAAMDWCCCRGSSCIGDRMEVPMRHLLQDNSTADSSAGPSNELVEVASQLLHLLHVTPALLSCRVRLADIISKVV